MEPPLLLFFLACNLLDSRHDDPNRVAPADRVPRLLDHIDKVRCNPSSDGCHGGDIESRDAFVNSRIVFVDAVPTREGVTSRNRFDLLLRIVSGHRERVTGQGEPRARLGGLGNVVRVAEAQAPMAEVRAYDEGVARVLEVRGEQGPECVLGRGSRAPNHDWHQRRVLRCRGVGVLQLQQAVDVGEVKLDAVLVFVDGACHRCEADAGAIWSSCLRRQELGDDLRVERQRLVGKRGIVGGELGQRKG
jgi:hypothetical protein